MNYDAKYVVVIHVVKTASAKIARSRKNVTIIAQKLRLFSGGEGTSQFDAVGLESTDFAEI